MFCLSPQHETGGTVNHHRTRYVGGPKLDTPTTAQRADALKARMQQLRNGNLRHDDIHNPYDMDDDERHGY